MTLRYIDAILNLKCCLKVSVEEAKEALAKKLGAQIKRKPELADRYTAV